jgi:hypothetical protein
MELKNNPVMEQSARDIVVGIFCLNYGKAMRNLREKENLFVRTLLADAETTEDHAEYVIGIDFARDLAESVHRIAQFDTHECEIL